MQAEQRILASGANKEYLPIEGLDTFRKATVDLLLGAGHPAIKEVRVPHRPRPRAQAGSHWGERGVLNLCLPAARTLLCPQNRVAALQALSGTGALRVGAAFIARYFKVRSRRQRVQRSCSMATRSRTL